MKTKAIHTPLPQQGVSDNSCFAVKALASTLLLLLSACQGGGSGSLLSNVSGLGADDEISFRNPPELNETLIPQNGLVACKSEELAMTMALTGFLLDTCHTVTYSDQYQVRSLEIRDLADGNKTWMVKVEGSGGTAWVPLPWHDWV